MKSKIYTLILFFAAAAAVTSCSNDVWDELPGPIANFFTTYFPGEEVNAYSEGQNSSIASVRNGVTVTFDSGNSWVVVNGNGSTLPEVFVYDQLPDALYRYLQEMEATGGVYKVSRGDGKYVVELLDSYIEYDIATGNISYVTGQADLRDLVKGAM